MYYKINLLYHNVLFFKKMKQEIIEDIRVKTVS